MTTRTVELRIPEPRPVVLDPTHAAVVVVDVENEFSAAGGPSLPRGARRAHPSAL